MKRYATRITKRVFALATTLAFTLILAAAAFILTRQRAIPVTGVVNPAQLGPSAPRSIDLGAGYMLEMDGTQGKIVAPPVMLKPPSASGTSQRIELGAGYTLEMDGMQGRIVAQAAPAVPLYQRIDIGSGYSLAMDGTQGKIVISTDRLEQPALATSRVQQVIDIGAGYVLETHMGIGRIIAPAPVLVQAAPATQLIDIGAGHILEMSGWNGKILVPPAPLNAQLDP